MGRLYRSVAAPPKTLAAARPQTGGCAENIEICNVLKFLCFSILFCSFNPENDSALYLRKYTLLSK